MNTNEQLIATFYAAFAHQDANKMSNCYHSNIQFQDPAFGILKGKAVSDMWKMLIERSNGNLKIEFSDINSHEDSVSAKWIATYTFRLTNRKVINVIEAKFNFQDGLILHHTDSFDLWKWSRQAFGLKGWLLGWTGFMQNKIQEQAQLSLKKYQNRA